MSIYEELGIRPHRITDTLKTDEEIKLLLEECANENDDELLLHVLGKLAKEMGMTELSRASGISREHLYKALAPEGNPSYKTLCAVLDALGLRFRIERKPDYEEAHT